MTHTPGPWEMWTSCSFRRISSKATCRDGDVLHAVVQRDGHPDLHFPNGGFNGPDARLMLASPRLLELLRRYIESDKRQGLTGTTLHMEALSAIAEVEGADGVTGYDAPERVKVGELIIPGISGEEYDEPEVLTPMKVLEQLQERLVRNGNDRVLDLFVELPAGVDVPRGGEQ